MRLLLDTHIILWSTAEPERLPPGIIERLAGPADRFLAPTALVYHLTLVTADKKIIEAKSVPVLSAL